MQVQQLADQRLPVLAVGFSPPDALAALAEHLDWRGPFLADEQRRLYQRLGLRRAPIWRVYSPSTLAWYARARARGHTPRRPVEDTRQMGGDAVVVAGVVVQRWAPRTPDDRVDPDRLVRAALGLRGVPGR